MAESLHHSAFERELKHLSVEKTVYRSGLPFQVLESFLDRSLGLRRRHAQGQARRSAIVAVQIHGVFQSGNSVFGGHRRRTTDAVLPVTRSFFFACAVGFPNRNGGIRSGVGKREDAARRAHERGG